MKLTFPHMGTPFISVKVLLDTRRNRLLHAALRSRKTMDLWVSCSPEFMCLPFKTGHRDFIQGLENGADVILFRRRPAGSAA
jgi:hypothetical protein